MLGNGRLIALAAALAALASGCRRDADGDRPAQRSAQTSSGGSVAGACAPNGRVPTVTSGGIGGAHCALVGEVGQSCTALTRRFRWRGHSGAGGGDRVRWPCGWPRCKWDHSRLLVADSAFVERGSASEHRRAALNVWLPVRGGREGTVAVCSLDVQRLVGLDTRLSISARQHSRAMIVGDSRHRTRYQPGVITEGVARCGS